MAQSVSQVAVLNTIQALAADLSLSGGKMTCTDLGDAIKIADGVSYVITPFTAGTAFVKTATFPATPVASTSYFLSVFFPEAKAFPNGGQEENALSRVRTYEVYTAESGETGTTLAAKFAVRINADLFAKVTATSAAAVLTYTQKATSLAAGDGDSVDTTTNGVTLANPTPFVAPSGTFDIVNAAKPGSASATGEYSTYDITFNKLTTKGVAQGAKAYLETRAVIYADELAANFADFDTELAAILDGSHTPVADYLGI